MHHKPTCSAHAHTQGRLSPALLADPLGPAHVREKTKAAFFANAGLADEDALMRAVYKGRWWVKELAGIIQ